MIEAKRKENESFDSLLRRFNKRIQQSRILQRTKEERFYQKPLSDLKAKRRAAKRAELRAKREYLKKIGRLDDINTIKK
ncbi:MAG TPA: 30S ribosomal protein S21 [bacterium]|nr:30S ribosomal protein S21 [Patescibacteria group bacterium]HOC96486.1 30S ribosomal protein S21 [bacterium]HPO11318.1 30S ribosomal protein S21 [bacterium]HQL11642.1 30S ribosomal protein S21 [bacterium]